MITILSPAKTLKMEKALNTNLYTQPIFINEASALIKELIKYSPPKEYSTVIDISKLNVEVITPVFKEYRNGVYKGITVYTKRARGLMSRFIIENNIISPNELNEFNEEGYSYNEYLSSKVELVFTR